MSTRSHTCLFRRTVSSFRDVCRKDPDCVGAAGVDFLAADAISDLNCNLWDTVACNGSLFLSRPYLSALEAATPGNLRYRYGIILRGQDPLAVLAVQIIDLSGRELVSAERAVSEPHVSHNPLARLKRSAQNAALHFMGGRLVVCGNFFSTGLYGAAFRRQEDPQRTWPVAVEALWRIADQERATYVLIKDVASDNAVCVDALRRLGFNPLATEPEMVLDLVPHWKSHGDYLHDLNAKYRKAARNVLDEIEQAGCVVDRLEDLRADADRLHALYLEVERRARVSFAAFPREYLPTLAKTMGGDHFRCNVVRLGDAIFGFIIMLKDGDTAVAHYAGLDYAANTRLPVYFRLLHTAIADAIEWRCRRLSFGRTASEPKARLGARPVPLASWVRHRHPATNLLVRILTGGITYKPVPQRHPFRNTTR